MAEMVKVKFDGVEYELEKGQTILEASKKLGIDIPYFCWHKHLSISGNCRMCLVEVTPGPPKPQVACGTYIADGMEVVTNSDKIKHARKAVLEFLLLNHPLDCPVCDEAYECKLQDYTFEYGPESSRFVPFHDKKRIYRREDYGKLFMEMNRCIECTRCVRYLKEIAGEYALERTHRGHHLKIASYKDAFESDFILNAADLCPVGALEDRKFHFVARAWDLERIETICPSCSIGCNIYLDSFEGKVKRFMPRENNDVNACWICDTGRHSFDFVNDNRILSPQIKKGEQFEEAAYMEALEHVKRDVEEVKKVNSDKSVAVLLSSKMTNEELFAAREFAGLIGAGKLGVATQFNERPIVPVMSDILPKTLVSDDKTPNSTGARLLGLDEGTKEKPFAVALIEAIEAGDVKALMLFHEDFFAIEGLDEGRVKAAIEKLSLFVVVASNQSETTKLAHVLIPAATFAEKNGTFTNHKPRLQRIHKAFNPTNGVWTDLGILTELGRLFDTGFGFDSMNAAFAEMAKNVKEYDGLSFEEIGLKGVALSDEKGGDEQ